NRRSVCAPRSRWTNELHRCGTDGDRYSGIYTGQGEELRWQRDQTSESLLSQLTPTSGRWSRYLPSTAQLSTATRLLNTSATGRSGRRSYAVLPTTVRVSLRPK